MTVVLDPFTTFAHNGYPVGSRAKSRPPLAIAAHEVIGTILNGTGQLPDFLRGRVDASSVSKNRAALFINTEDARVPVLGASIRGIIVYEHNEVSVYSPEAFALRFRPAEN